MTLFYLESNPADAGFLETPATTGGRIGKNVSLNFSLVLIKMVDGKECCF